MLASLTPLLLDAKRGRYAVGAFNVLMLEYALGVVKAAECEKSPVILQISPSVISFFGLTTILAPCLELAKKSSVPICVHLDHGKTRNQVIEAINEGFSSVMFDGSSLSLEENSQETAFLTALAHQKKVSMEAEIGKVGKEEDESSSLTSNLTLTSIQDAIHFLDNTTIDALAISIGSIHGLKKQSVELDIDLLKQIRKVVSVPLVLHGSSGVTDQSIIAAIRYGITKINVATRLKVEVAKALYTISKNPKDAKLTDSRFLSQTIVDAVYHETTNRIQLFNSISL